MPASHSSGSSAVIHGASRSSRCPRTHKALQQECYYGICSMTAPSQPSGEKSFGKSTYSHRQQAQTRVHTQRKSTEAMRENFSPLKLHLSSLMETNMENLELPFRFITTWAPKAWFKSSQRCTKRLQTQTFPSQGGQRLRSTQQPWLPAQG